MQRQQARYLVLILAIVGGACFYFGNRLLCGSKHKMAGKWLIGASFFCLFMIVGARDLV